MAADVPKTLNGATQCDVDDSSFERHQTGQPSDFFLIYIGMIPQSSFIGAARVVVLDSVGVVDDDGAVVFAERKLDANLPGGGEQHPESRVVVRAGDTHAAERRREHSWWRENPRATRWDSSSCARAEKAWSSATMRKS